MSVCEGCKYENSFCRLSLTSPSNRWTPCASYRKEEYDQERAQKTQTSEDSNRQRIIQIIKANKRNSEGLG